MDSWAPIRSMGNQANRRAKKTNKKKAL